MAEYLDRDFAAVSGVLLLYSGRGAEKVNVPARLGGEDIHTVGKGAFEEAGDMCAVNVPAGIRTLGERAFYCSRRLREIRFQTLPDEIGPQAFFGCDNLSKITVGAFSLPQGEYRSLLEDSMRCGTTRVARRFPSSDEMKRLTDALSFRSVNRIPHGVPCLFIGESEDANAFFGRSPVPCFDFRNGKTAAAEMDAFYDLMRAGTDLRRAEAEKKNDDCRKRDQCPAPDKTLLFTFDENSAHTSGSCVIFTVCLLVDRFYWQSGATMCGSNGKTCEIYMRNYLYPEQDFPYVRKETAILRGGSRITDTEELNYIYGKYEMLTLL